LSRCPLTLGSCTSEAQVSFFQFGHSITFMVFGLAVGRRY
jgi:hypothetical protein